MANKQVEFLPCANAPIVRNCDMPDCNEPAIVDCQLTGRTMWAYMCMGHFLTNNNYNPQLVNNITLDVIVMFLPPDF